MFLSFNKTNFNILQFVFFILLAYIIYTLMENSKKTFEGQGLYRRTTPASSWAGTGGRSIYTENTLLIRDSPSAGFGASGVAHLHRPTSPLAPQSWTSTPPKSHGYHH